MKKPKFSFGWGLAIAAIAAIAGLAWLNRTPTVVGVTSVPNMGNTHIADIDTSHASYNSNPPTSGPHVGRIARWGVHDTPIADELQVHNLEDGGVIIQYNPAQVSADEQEQLEGLVAASGRKHVIVAPRSDMDHTIAATAWNTRLPLERVDNERLLRFIAAYEGVDHHAGS